MKQVKTGRMVVTVALVVGMLAGPNTYGGTTTLNGGTLTLANTYSNNELAVAADSTISVSRNFTAIWDGALTGSSTLTLTTSGSGYIGGTGLGTGQQLSLINNSGNTFSGNITINSGVLRIAGNPFAANAGFIAPSMGSGNTITTGVGGSLLIDDNALTGGYVADRFGSSGNRPAVDLTGGTLSLSGLNNASSSVQTFGALTASSGLSLVNVTRNSSGSPLLQFDSFTRNSGAVVTFNDNGTSTMGTNNTGAPRVLFTTGPTLINGILAGARYHNVTGGGVGNFVTYGTDGIRQFTASDYTDVAGNDINGAAATANVRFTEADPFDALSSDVTVNSLHISPSGSPGTTWAMGNTLTLVSGMLMKSGWNSLIDITSGTLTAGTGSDIDLHIMIQQERMTFSGTSVIADNGSGKVTLVKSEAQGNTLTLNSGSNNTYSGGTYLLGGALNTGNVADRRYLGSGKVVVDNGRVGGSNNNNTILTLGSRGATFYSGPGADYTAINGGRINLANTAYTADDTFDIKAASVIHGSTTALNSLTRGTNITLAADSIISHSSVLGAALNLSTGTIKDLGTNADLYYGLGVSQNNAGGIVTIGNGTAFKGIGTPRGNINWDLGTINVASGTSDVYLFNNNPDRNPDVFGIGNGATESAPIITLTDAGTVDFNVLGRVRFNDSDFVFGDTANDRYVRFVAAAGSSLEFIAANGMGSGTGIASALVEAGGTLRYNGGSDSATALNGNVTFQEGGRYEAMLTSGITGSGQLTFEEGSIIQVNTVLGFSGSQASEADIAAGTIVRLNVNSFGSSSETLDSVLGSGSKHVNYVITGGNNAVNPTSGPTAVYTLNKSAGGLGGVLANDLFARTVNNLGNGNITLGANGGVIAATDNTTFTISEDITGSGSLTIGTTNIIDGAPKEGTVILGNTVNNYTGGTVVNAGTLQLGNVDNLGSTSGSLTVNGGLLNLNNMNGVIVGNLTGTGGIIANNGNNHRILTIGEGNGTGGNFEGVIVNTTGANSGTLALTKTGTGTNTLSGANTYTGATAVNGGMLLINGDQSTASGTVTVADGATLGGTGVIGGDVTISANGRLAFHLSTEAASHDKLELAASKSLTFSGASVLDITATDLLAAPGVYTLVTAPGGINGTLPATVNLPDDYVATVQMTGNDLELNVTAVPATGGPLDYFEISAIDAGTAGTAIEGIMLTAKDADGLTANFSGTVTFSGTAGVTGESGAFTLGVLTGVSVTPTVAGSGMTLIVTDSDSGKTGTVTFDVSPGALDHFAISSIGSPQTAGTPITGLTLTARDAYNNTVTGFGGTVTYSGTAGISGTSASFTAGVLTGVSVTPTVAGSDRTFTVTASDKTGTATFDVNPGAVHQFSITGFTPTGVVGTPITGITITAQDANNNTVTGFSGTVTFGGTAGITGVSGSFTAGVLTGVSVTPTEAGTGVTLTVSDGFGNTGSVDSNVGWVDGMVMVAAANVQVGTTTPVASVRANSLYPPVTYAITGGRDAASFNINAATGELTLTSPAGVVGTKYYVLVTATDSKAGTPNTDSILVEVTSTSAAVLSGTVFKFR